MAHSDRSSSQRGSSDSTNGHPTSRVSSQSSLSSSTSTSSKDEPGKNLQRLCFYINGKVNDRRCESMYNFATQFLNANSRKNKKESHEEEFNVDKIRKQLMETRGPTGVATFDRHYRQIKEWGELSKRRSVLQFLYRLSDSDGTVQQVPLADNSRLLTTIMSPKPYVKPPSSGPSLTDFMKLPPPVVNSSRVHDNALALSEQRSNAMNGMPSQCEGQGFVPRSQQINSVPAVTESQLIQDLIYVFQGIDGKFLKCNKLDGAGQRYNFDAKLTVPRKLRVMSLRLATLGWLHNKVRDHCSSWATIKSNGVVAQSLTAALREQLTEYYRLLANLQVQVTSSLDSGSDLTLRDLGMWAADPRDRFIWLATVVDQVQGLRGGAIVSCVHALLQHGVPSVRDIVTHLLAAVCKPIFRMLSLWMLEGQLDDPHGEFFISAFPSPSTDQLWHDQHSVKASMVPTFISMKQAGKILATGKSINFLREVCKDSLELRCRDQLEHGLEASSVEALIMSDRVEELTALMDVAYLETSTRVIDVMKHKYKLEQHLKAMRDFLLLGQGDFIRYLMELLEPELVKPSTDVFSHNLSSILDSAVRATNAQFADPDVLRRLDIRILDQTPGDHGWDIFALDYHTQGPISTVFTGTATPYLLLFKSLWRTKRIEFILSRMWKEQFTASKLLLPKIPELHTVLQQTHLLTHEMVHTVHQLQYYFMFEVIECSWERLRQQVHEAESLDDIIRAHHSFLEEMQRKALLDSDSYELSVQLGAMCETIMQLKSQVDKLHLRAQEEVDMRARRQAEIEECIAQKTFGLTDKREKFYAKATQVFLQQFLPNARIQFKTLATSYQNRVRTLMQMLASSEVVELQLLCFRLDFSEHYKHIEQLRSK